MSGWSGGVSGVVMWWSGVSGVRMSESGENDGVRWSGYDDEVEWMELSGGVESWWVCGYVMR